MVSLQEQLYYLRIAAWYWLQEHPDNKNAPMVKEALTASEGLTFPIDERKPVARTQQGDLTGSAAKSAKSKRAKS